MPMRQRSPPWSPAARPRRFWSTSAGQRKINHRGHRGHRVKIRDCHPERSEGPALFAFTNIVCTSASAGLQARDNLDSTLMRKLPQTGAKNPTNAGVLRLGHSPSLRMTVVAGVLRLGHPPSLRMTVVAGVLRLGHSPSLRMTVVAGVLRLGHPPSLRMTVVAGVLR